MRATLALGLPVICLGLFVSAPAVAGESQWMTEFGPLALRVDGANQVIGGYPERQGGFVGELDPAVGAIGGYWLQPSSEVRCARERFGTPYWGRVAWRSVGDGRLVGQWAYCDQPMDSGGSWHARLVQGTNPFPSITAPSPPAPSTPASEAPGAAPSPEMPDATIPGDGIPNDDGEAEEGGDPDSLIETATRVLWGEGADVLEVSVQRGDFLCDGRRATYLTRLDRSAPGGAVLDVALVEPGRRWDETPQLSIPFGGLDASSFSGNPRSVPGEGMALDLATAMGHTGAEPPLCPTGLRLPNGRGGSLWVFARSNGQGPAALVLGHD